MKLYHFIFITTAIFTVFFFSEFFLKEPPVWPDEPIYAEVAGNLIRENRLGNDLQKGMLPGVEKHVLGYPPVFFYSLAAWFKVFGFSITSQRLLSTAAGILFLVVFYFFIKHLLKDQSLSKWVSWLTISALIVDFTFIRALRVSRPEIIILLFGILALWFIQKTIEDAQPKLNRSFFSVFSGLFASLASLTHPIAIFISASIITYLLFTKRLAILKIKSFYLFFAAYLAPIAIWIVSIIPDFNLFKAQFFTVFLRKSMEELWFLTALKTQTFELKMIYLLYLLITLVFVFLYFNNSKKPYRFLTIILSISWLATFAGKMFWYQVFPVPFIYLALSLLIFEGYNFCKEPPTQSGRNLLYLPLGLALLLIFFNLKLQFDGAQKEFGDNFSYEIFTNEVLKNIPPNKTVFLSSIPDSYYGLKIRNTNNPLYQFPPVDTPRENYLSVLNDCDYIVYNGSYNSDLFGDFLEKYIDKNYSKYFQIGETDQYRATVIELKPKTERISP
jgi:4-amino-4-deoxy-L-arabinose transferase-like glycosyltransferase